MQIANCLTVAASHAAACYMPHADAFSSCRRLATVVKIAAKFKFDRRQGEQADRGRQRCRRRRKPRVANLLLAFSCFRSCLTTFAPPRTPPTLPCSCSSSHPFGMQCSSGSSSLQLPWQALIKLERRRLSAPRAAAQSDMQNIFEITQP